MDDEAVRVVPANEYRRTRWRNGRGWTREILALSPLPGPAAGAGAAPVADWDLRLSIAEIEGPAAFSVFPDVEREQALLAGNGLRLEFEDGGRVQLLPPHQVARFSGGRAASAIPLDGPVQVFNLMWRPAVLEARLLHRPLVGGMWCFCDAHSAWAVYVLAGAARVDGDAGPVALAQGDSAWLGPGPTRRRYRLEGAGEVLLVQATWPGAGDGLAGFQ